MPSNFAAIRFCLVWLLAGAIAAQAGFNPAAGWLIAASSLAEEESDSRECPAEEQLEEVLAAGSQRVPRDHQAPHRTAECAGVHPQRRLSPRALHPRQPIEMARRNGVGSLLRC